MAKKIALVTGSSRGIGYGILECLAKENWTVVMSDIFEEEKVAESLAKLQATGADASYVQCDISNAESRGKALATLAERYGRVDLLVNNAGVAPNVRRNILETTEDSFDRLININLKGTFFMSQLFANQMIAWKNAGLADYMPRIINQSSCSAYTSSTSRGEYCISKAGIAMVTSLFADMLAIDNIPVFEIRPGIIKSDMTATVEEKYNKFILEDGGLPTRRWGLPEDIGRAAAALASGAFDYSTGQVINVDGGFHIRRL